MPPEQTAPQVRDDHAALAGVGGHTVRGPAEPKVRADRHAHPGTGRASLSEPGGLGSQGPLGAGRLALRSQEGVAANAELLEEHHVGRRVAEVLLPRAHGVAVERVVQHPKFRWSEQAFASPRVAWIGRGSGVAVRQCRGPRLRG